MLEKLMFMNLSKFYLAVLNIKMYILIIPFSECVEDSENEDNNISGLSEIIVDLMAVICFYNLV